MFLTRRFYIVMTVVILVIAGGYLWLPLFTIGRGLLLALLLMLTADLLLLYRGGTLSATRQCSNRFSNGDENLVTVAVTSTYRIPVSVAAIDETPVEFQLRNNEIRLSTPLLDREGQGGESYSLRPTRRGIYSFGHVRLFAKTRIGLAERRFTTGQPQEVKVYPSFVRLSQYEFLAIHNNLTEQGIKRIRRVGHHTEFEQIKDYVSGDDYRTINWRATARSHQLMVNVYRQERSQQIYSLIDKGRVMQQAFNAMTLLDYAINAALALSFVAMRKEDRAGLITFAAQVDTFLPPPSGGRAGMGPLMEVLYAQQTDFGETDYSALCVSVNQHIAKRSLLVLYTNFTTLVALRRQLPYLQQLNRRHRLLVVFFEDEETAALRSQGVKKPSSQDDTLSNLTPHSTLHTPQGYCPDSLTPLLLDSSERSLFPHVIAEKFAYEKRLMVEVLRQHGITALLTPPDQLSVNVINKYLEIKQQSL